MIALYLFVGFMVGGTVGVVTMCCFQAVKESERRTDEAKNHDKKE